MAHYVYEMKFREKLMWECCECGEVAEYSKMGKKYCEKHWCVDMGIGERETVKNLNK